MFGGYYLGQLYLGISGLPASGNITVQSDSHQLSSDNITLTQKQTIVIADTLHGLTSGNITLIQKHLVTADDAYHTLMSENVAITSEQVLGINSAFHGLTSTTLDLTQKHTLVVNNTAHGLTSDNIQLVEHFTLAVANTLHGHTAETPAIVVHFYLVVANALHGHTAQNITLTQKQLLVVADTLHGLTSTTLAGLLSIEPFGFGGGFGAVDGYGYSGFGVINTELVQNYYIRGLDSYHTLLTDAAPLTQKHTLVTNNGYILVSTANLDLSQYIWFDGGVYIMDSESEGEAGSEYTPGNGTTAVEHGYFGQIAPVADSNLGFLVVEMGSNGSYAINDTNNGILNRSNSGQGNLTTEVEDTGNYIKSNNNSGEYEAQ